MKTASIWAVTPCSPVEIHRRYGGKYRLQLCLLFAGHSLVYGGSSETSANFYVLHSVTSQKATTDVRTHGIVNSQFETPTPSEMAIKSKQKCTLGTVATSLFSKQINSRLPIFWDITPCRPLSVNRRFGGTYRLQLQDRKNKLCKKPA
jgi:hypothetical protein